MGLMQSMVNRLTGPVVRAISGERYLSIQMDVTNACNLKCAHCYHSHHKNTGALDLEGWHGILDEYQGLLNELHRKPSFIFCGGEPLLSPHLLPLIQRISNQWPGAPIYILTNGIKINLKLLQALKGLPVTFQVSLDGPDSISHDSIRGEGVFEKATAGLKLAKQKGFKVQLLSILSKNTAKTIPQFFQLARSLNVNAMNFTRFLPVGTGHELSKSGKDQALLGFELKAAMEKIIDQSALTEVRSNTNQPLYHLIDPNLGTHGRYGFQSLIVDYKGNLKVSSRINFQLGHIPTEGLRNLFLQHPVMKSLRKGQIKGCGSCSHCARCGGDRNMSYAVTGSFLNEDIGCWLKNANTKHETINTKQGEKFYEAL